MTAIKGNAEDVADAGPDMNEWDVSIDFALPEGFRRFDARVGDRLVAATERYEGVVSVLPGRVTIAVTVRALGHRKAIDNGISAARGALRAARCRDDFPIERIEAKTAARAERDIEEPTYPEMLGVSEVAEFLCVSKQRVGELRESGRLPAPIGELRAGPVWARPTIERFLERWSRRPGRPPGTARPAGLVREGKREMRPGRAHRQS